MKRKLAVLTTHPIQYQAPWFRAMQAHPRLDPLVLFGHRATPAEQAAAGFGVEFEWDAPLLEGYRHRFLRNQSSSPGLGRFRGIDSPDLRDVLSPGEFDAVIVNGWHYKAAWQAFAACWRGGTPVMARGDSHLRTPRGPLTKLLKWPPYRAFIPKMDACLAVGSWSTEYFLHYGARRNRVFVVPHVVETGNAAERQAGARRTEARRRFGLDKEAIVFLFAGKFLELKRPLDFVRALADVTAKRPEAAGLMVGDGSLRPDCAAVAEPLGARLRMPGFLNQSEIGDAYLAADVLVLPSSEETWGMAVSEALAWGRPCIVTDRVGCGPDRIVPLQTGFVYSVGDVSALAGWMEWCCAHPRRLDEMKFRSAQMAARHSVDEAVKGVLEALSLVAPEPVLENMS